MNNNVNREEVEPRQEPFGENSQIRSTKNKVEGQSS